MPQPTILVVDDDLFFRRLLEDILAEEGDYRVETVASGEAALERVALGGVEVLLTRRVSRDGDPWSGHVALPGGVEAPGDVDLVDTARRELQRRGAPEWVVAVVPAAQPDL